MSRISSWPGSSSTVTHEVDRVVVVDVDALDRRACGPSSRWSCALRPGAGRRRRGRRARNVTPVDGDRLLAADLGVGLGRAAIAIVTRPCRRHDVLRAWRSAARSSISRTAGSLLGDLVALVVAEREHVQQQRLLDLGGVEQVAAALGRDLRVVGQDDRRAEHRVVGGRGEHREGVDVGARHDRRRGVLGRRDRRHEAPAGGAAHDDVRREQRAAQRRGAVEPVGDLGRVVHARP